MPVLQEVQNVYLVDQAHALIPGVHFVRHVLKEASQLDQKERVWHAMLEHMLRMEQLIVAAVLRDHGLRIKLAYAFSAPLAPFQQASEQQVRKIALFAELVSSIVNMDNLPVRAVELERLLMGRELC